MNTKFIAYLNMELLNYDSDGNLSLKQPRTRLSMEHGFLDLFVEAEEEWYGITGVKSISSSEYILARETLKRKLFYGIEKEAKW